MNKFRIDVEAFEFMSNKWVWWLCYIATIALFVTDVSFDFFDLLAPVQLATIWLFFISLIWVITSLSVDDDFYKSHVDIKYKSFQMVYINLNIPYVLKEGRLNVSILSCFLFIVISQSLQWSLFDTLFEVTGTPSYLFQGIFFHLFFIALSEEVFFRGMLYRLFNHSFLLYTLIGSVLFGLIHFSGGLNTMLIAGCAGLFLSTLRWFGASIISLIIAHSTVNILNNIFYSFNTPKYSAPLTTLIMCAVFIAASVVVAKILRKGQQAWNTQHNMQHR